MAYAILFFFLVYDNTNCAEQCHDIFYSFDRSTWYRSVVLRYGSGEFLDDEG